MNDERLAELKEKYKERNLLDELAWGAYANHMGYTSKQNGEFLNWLCMMAYKALKERPQGKWIKEDDEHLKGWYRCSECGRRVEDLTDDIVIHAGCEDYTVADIYPFCHCGAEMKGGAE